MRACASAPHPKGPPFDLQQIGFAAHHLLLLSLVEHLLGHWHKLPFSGKSPGVGLPTPRQYAKQSDYSSATFEAKLRQAEHTLQRLRSCAWSTRKLSIRSSIAASDCEKLKSPRRYGQAVARASGKSPWVTLPCHTSSHLQAGRRLKLANLTRAATAFSRASILSVDRLSAEASCQASSDTGRCLQRRRILVLQHRLESLSKPCLRREETEHR